MKHRNNHFAVGYWSRIRCGRALPDQTDIDPKVLKRLLPFVFLLDARPDGSFVHRLAGTAWGAHIGGFITGLFLTPVLSRFPLFGRQPRGPWG